MLPEGNVRYFLSVFTLWKCLHLKAFLSTLALMFPKKLLHISFIFTLMALGQSEELVSRGAYPRHYQTRKDLGCIKPVHICQVVFGGFNFFPFPGLTAILVDRTPQISGRPPVNSTFLYPLDRLSWGMAKDVIFNSSRPLRKNDARCPHATLHKTLASQFSYCHLLNRYHGPRTHNRKAPL